MGDLVFEDELARSLLSAQHPDLAGLELRAVNGGWDNQMWRLGEDLALRLPRTERAPELLEKEHLWIPELAHRLPLPVPIPVRVGEPSELFPDMWIVSTWVPGEPADLAPVERGDHAAETLAEFLRDLHLKAPDSAPQTHRGIPLGLLTEHVERRLEQLNHQEAAPKLREVWVEAVSAADWDGLPVWLHADLHPANVVVEDGTLAGVIDFGELCAGDPAADLGSAWVLLPDGAAKRFFDAYAKAVEDTVRRARGWALINCLLLLEVGHAGEMGWAGGKPTWKPTGEAAVERLLASVPG